MNKYYLRLCGARNANDERCRFAMGHPAEHLWGHPENMEEECESCGIGYSRHLESGHPFAWTGRFTTKRTSTPAEALIYERHPGGTCSCAAYRAAGVAAACSRCTPSPPSISEVQRAAWEPKGESAGRLRSGPTSSAMLGEVLTSLAAIRRIADSLNIHEAVNHIDMATFAVERELNARRGAS